MTHASQPSNPGGAAPAPRQCHYLKSDGHKCRDWAIRGQDYCARHDRFVHWRPESPIDVPLLEDEASVVLLLSETLRALAWGTIPVANGRMLLAGCRQAHTMQCQRLEMAKFRLRLRRLNIPEAEIFDHQSTAPEPAPLPGSSEPVLSNCDPEGGTRRTDLVPCPVPVSECAQNSRLGHQAEAEHEPTPVLQPNPRSRFRDLKKNWDKELLHSQNEMTDMRFKRHGETPEEFKAARATPFQDLANEEQIAIAVL